MMVPSSESDDTSAIDQPDGDQIAGVGSDSFLLDRDGAYNASDIDNSVVFRGAAPLAETKMMH